MALITAASGVSPASAFGFSIPCVRARESFSARLLHRALLHGTQEQAQRKLGVVLEQAVGPGGAEAALVHRVGDARERPPQACEQPVAFAQYTRSPNSWVSSLA